MKFSVLIGGKAGEGIEKSSVILAKSLIKLGFYCFVYREYGSYIKGGHDFSIVTFSPKKIMSHENEIDLLLAFDKFSYEKHASALKKEGITLCGDKINEKGCYYFDYRKIVEEVKAPSISKNSAFLGACFKIFNFPFHVLSFFIKKELDEINDRVAAKAYSSIDFSLSEKVELPKPTYKKRKVFIDGTSAIGLGSIYSGLDIYYAYPMTPATRLLHFLSSLREKFDIKTFQLENEIAVVSASLGSNFAGAISLLGTSGGGFDLMIESVSFQGMSEIPLVIYLAQRAGPSTGMPTYTSQSDLNDALYSGHGDFPRVVIAPGDAMEAFEKTVEAFYLSFKYNILSIILSDKHLAESYYTFDRIVKPKVVPRKFLLENPKNFKTYKLTSSGISPRTYPEKAVVKVNSYEHDEFGFTTDSSEISKIMQEKRKRKFQNLCKEVEKKFEMFRIFGEGDNLILSFGSNKGAILDALSSLNDFRFLHIIYLSPLPIRVIKREIEKSKKVYVVENNSSGQFLNLIGSVSEKRIIPILKYDGRPFTSKEIVNLVSR